MTESAFPMRINKYLAHNKYSTRRGADELIEKGLVLINGKKAVLGDKVEATDTVEVKGKKRTYRYVAYNKPRGIITHSAQEGEQEIKEILPIEGLFPVGRLDKDSYGLIILTDDGRLTEALLNPDHAHEKEYIVQTLHALPKDFKHQMERGVVLGDYRTKPCVVRIQGAHKFAITLTEGKKHQIRRMCGVFGQSAVDLRRVRIMNIRLGQLESGQHRAIEGKELETFLSSVGLA